MKKKFGIHFYINIVNYNEIIDSEQKKTGKLNHSIHALDTYFTSIEQYALESSVSVEKITGSRLHLFVEGTVSDICSSVFKVINFAYVFAGQLNTIGKYRLLNDFKINVGAAFGKFYDYDFVKENSEYEEETSIGFACNFAAKLQSVACDESIAIDDDIYNEIKHIVAFEKINNPSFELKYNKPVYYQTELSKIRPLFVSRQHTLDNKVTYYVKKANEISLSDMNGSGVRERINFSNISKKDYKVIEGIPLFADVRGFTGQFKEDDSNLDEMGVKTRNILEAMYDAVNRFNGTHVQFQGDREFAIFNEYENYSCVRNAILAGMKMIDVVKENGVSIGIGASFGKLFCTKIGARGNKDNIVLGQAVLSSDILEDNEAGKNQIVIDKTMFEKLKEEDSTLSSYFHPLDNNNTFYIDLSFSKYQLLIEQKEQRRATQNNSYNGAWSCDE